MLSDWLTNVLINYQLKKNNSESDSNHADSLCRYHYSCGVNCYFIFTTIFIIIVIIFWCERAFRIKQTVIATVPLRAINVKKLYFDSHTLTFLLKENHIGWTWTNMTMSK